MGGLPLTQLRFKLLNCIMILLSSTIKEQRHHAEREPAYQQIGTRYIDDPDCGNVYEISYVVKGEVTAKKLNEYLNVVRKEVDREELGTNIVKVSYYRNRVDALAWKETDMREYTFLNVE